MPIPDYQSIMLPLLQLASDGEEHRFRDAVEYLENHFELDEEEKNELLPSGSQAVFRNRVGWARTYLKQAGLLDAGPKQALTWYRKVVPSMDETEAQEDPGEDLCPSN